MSATIDSQLELWSAINEQLRVNSEELVEWGNLLVSFRDLLMESILIKLWAITHDKDLRTASSPNLISYVEHNLDLFSEDHVRNRSNARAGSASGGSDSLVERILPRNLITSNEIKELIQKLDGVSSILQNVEAHRHIRLAHLNRKQLSENGRLRDEHPLTLKEVRHAFEVCGEIWHRVSLGYDMNHQVWGVHTDMPRQRTICLNSL